MPQILGSSSIHKFRPSFLPLSITFRRIHERNSFHLGAICLFCFEFCYLIGFLIPIVTWWVFIRTFYSFSIKPLRYAIKSEQLSSKRKQRKRWMHLTGWHRFRLDCRIPGPRNIYHKKLAPAVRVINTKNLLPQCLSAAVLKINLSGFLCLIERIDGF